MKALRKLEGIVLKDTDAAEYSIESSNFSESTVKQNFSVIENDDGGEEYKHHDD
jgi:hypothetical protein